MNFSAWDNPMGTDGFEFIEYAAPNPAALGSLFESMGFGAVARHRHKNVTLYRQGEINFIINAEADSFAQRFARLHGPSICAIAFRVNDAAHAYRRALELGAWGYDSKSGPMELNIPAIKGIGDSLLYFVDRWRGKNGAEPGGIGDIGIYDVDFEPIAGTDPAPRGHGLTTIDHLTHNVHRGRMNEWAEFYERLFGFREIRYFDIEGKLTGLKSKAMTSPCGKIRIPINESSDDKSQIAEYLNEYHGEGIQHVALGTSDIYATVRAMRAAGVSFQDTIDTYYDLVDQRLPGHGENLDELRRLSILIDGTTHAGATGAGGKPEDQAAARSPELLLQIFTRTLIGPIFFEIIQRKGDEGFGEGNFRALFESIELDQVRRGVLQPDAAKSPA
jgi:4-hydroxyphenylpyruvate dioxygenase